MDADSRSQQLMIKDLTSQNDKLTGILNDLTNRVEQQGLDIENKIRLKEQLEQELLSTNNTLRVSIETRATLNDELAREKQKASDEQNELNDQVRALKASLTSSGDQVQHAREENEHMRDQNIELRQQNNELKSALGDSEDNNDNLQKEFNALKLAESEATHKIRELSRIIDEYTHNKAALESQLEVLVPEKELLETNYAELEQTHRRVLASRAETQKDLAATKVRLQNTEEARYVTESRREVTLTTLIIILSLSSWDRPDIAHTISILLITLYNPDPIGIGGQVEGDN